MKVGVPKEIKDNERRVGLVVDNVRALIKANHQVFVEAGCGNGIGIDDEDYRKVGATVVQDKETLYGEAKLIVKVKEPMPEDLKCLRGDHILFSYLHLAAVPHVGKALLEKGLAGVAYETVQLTDRSLPLLVPMSEIAGRMSILLAANCLRSDAGGKGLLLSGIPGVAPGRVAIIGGGVAGTEAAKIAVGLGAQVTILDINLSRLSYLDDIFSGRLTTLMSNQTNLERIVRSTDILIGAVLIAGAAAPKLISREMVSTMEKGSVVVDIAVDQGGCISTTKATSISSPTFSVDGVIHCCIDNIPATVSRTSTYALTNATFPYVKMLADLGLDEAMKQHASLRLGLNIFRGRCTHPEVARALAVSYEAPPF